MSLLIGTGKLLDQTVEIHQRFSTFLGVGLGLLVVIVLLIAWRRGWPLWSASWYMYGSWVVMALISFTIKSLPLRDSWRYTNALFLLWILLCIVAYFFLFARDRVRGIVTVAFLFPFLGVSMLEFIPNPIEGWLAISLGVLSSLIVGAVIRIGDFRIGLGLILSANIGAGLVLAFISEYQMKDLPPGIPPHDPKLTTAIGRLMFFLIFALGIICIPILLHRIRDTIIRRLPS